jgi:hypothetical protein
MTRQSPASTPEDLFEAIAKLLEPGQREYFYQRMLYFRHLRPEDELLRLVEAMGLLALLIREAPHAVAREREQMAQLLESSLATIHAAGEAGQAYQRQLDGRLSRLPAEVAEGISPDAIARAITESLRQQFVESGLPATADALTAISHQLTQATGQFQRTADLLSACAGRAEDTRRASDQMSASVAKATETARLAVETVRHEFRLECVRAVWLLCGVAWLFGIVLGVVFERWRIGGSPIVPQATAVPAPIGGPSSTEPTPKGPRHGTDVERRSNTRRTPASAEHAKPKA